MSEEATNIVKEGRHGGATIASLIARAEDCRSKATSAIEASTIAVQVENLEAAANLLLTASKLFMDSSYNYTQASMVDTTNGPELRQEAAEMTAIAQEVDRESKRIYATTTAQNREIIAVIPNTFEETWKSADDVEVWDVPFYKGDFDGHPFRGNQYAQGVGGSMATIRELTDRMKQGENLNYHEGDHQALADSHDYMSGFHFSKEEEARARGDREAMLAHRGAASEHAYAAGVASRAEQNADAWDRTSGSSDRSFDAEARMDDAPSTSETDALVLQASDEALAATVYAFVEDQSTYKYVP
jgi:hypothetical protein